MSLPSQSSVNPQTNEKFQEYIEKKSNLNLSGSFHRYTNEASTRVKKLDGKYYFNKAQPFLNRSSIQELVVIKSNLEMGRKKITIKPILNAQGRKITYNKRKVGLLKKVVEISAMCGVSVNLEFEDPEGNIIKIQALDGNLEKKFLSFSQNTFLLSTKDYPTFSALPEVERKARRTIKKKRRFSMEDAQSNPKEKLEYGVASNSNQDEKPAALVKSEASTVNCLPQVCNFEPNQLSAWPPFPMKIEFAPLCQQPQHLTQWLVSPIIQFSTPTYPTTLW